MAVQRSVMGRRSRRRKRKTQFYRRHSTNRAAPNCWNTTTASAARPLLPIWSLTAHARSVLLTAPQRHASPRKWAALCFQRRGSGVLHFTPADLRARGALSLKTLNCELASIQLVLKCQNSLRWGRINGMSGEHVCSITACTDKHANILYISSRG